MNCSIAIEKLVESARWRVEPDPALRTHLKACPRCLERWEAERVLTSHLRVMRIDAFARHSSEARGQELMRQFVSTRQPPARAGWVWTLAAAAVLLLAITVVREIGRRPAVAVVQNVAQVADAAVDSEEGFIAVPYVPPLATGELVRLVHTQLYPAALASLGVNVDPAWTTELPADLLIGQDGFPRAVRVTDDDSYERGF